MTSPITALRRSAVDHDLAKLQNGMTLGERMEDCVKANTDAAGVTRRRAKARTQIVRIALRSRFVGLAAGDARPVLPAAIGPDQVRVPLPSR